MAPKSSDRLTLSETERGYRALLQSTAKITGPTLISRVLGYLRDMLQAFFLGTGFGADAFTIAFVIPNLLRNLTAEGTLTAAFIPTFTRVRRSGSEEQSRDFVNAVFTVWSVIVLGVILLGMTVSVPLVKALAYGYSFVPGKLELTVSLLRIMFPYILFISLAALCSAVLNSYFKFGLAAASSIFFNLAMIATVFLLARKTAQPAYAFAVGVIAGGFAQLVVQVPAVRKMGISLRPSWDIENPAIRKMGRLILPGILGMGIFQINLALSRTLASLLAAGSVSALFYATRVTELTLGLFSLAVAKALLPALSVQAAEGAIDAMKKTLLFSLRFIAVITLPAAAGLLLLARPIIRLLFERGAFGADSTALTAAALVFFSVGLPFSSANKVLKKVFFSLEDTRTPVKVAVVTLALYLGTSLVLMQILDIGGLALGLSLSEVCYFGILLSLLQKKIGRITWDRFLRFLLKIAVCTSVMGGVLVGLRGALPPPTGFWGNLASTLGLIFCGLLSYGLAVGFIIRREIRSLWALLKTK
jgi:putative peptidoglycan lipid II flippase